MRPRGYFLIFWGFLLLLNGPEGAPARAQEESLQPRQTIQLPYKYVGNNFSHKFHRPSCPFAKQMWPQRIQLFHFRQQAIDCDYRPCRYCLPPVWTSVHACLRTAKPEPEPDPNPNPSAADTPSTLPAPGEP